MIVQEDVPYTKEEVKAMVNTIHDLREKVSQLGWHPASELPPVNEIGESQDVIVICGTTNLYFDLPRWSKVVEGVWGDKNVKWWCYPPEKEVDYGSKD